MPKNPDLQKVTLNLRQGDWDYLDSAFAARGYPTSAVVRNVVAKFVDNMRAQEAVGAPATIPLENIDV